MLKTKEYRTCDRCFQELTENAHLQFCSGIDYCFYDLCDKCYEDYMSYQSEMDDLKTKMDEIAEKYKFGRYIPKEDNYEESI